jgi:hypothetical protein
MEGHLRERVPTSTGFSGREMAERVGEL